MSLAERVNDLATRVATEINTLRTEIAAGGGGGGGGMSYGEDWAAGSYAVQSVVKRDGVVYVAKQATSDTPVLPVTDFETDFAGVDYAVSPWAKNGFTANQVVATVGGQTIPGETSTTAMEFKCVTETSFDVNVTLTLTFDIAGTIEFQDRADLETGWDKASFSIDGVSQQEVTGIVGWTARSFPVTVGEHVFRWRVWGDGMNPSTNFYRVGALKTFGSVISGGDWDAIAYTPSKVAQLIAEATA